MTATGGEQIPETFGGPDPTGPVQLERADSAPQASSRLPATAIPPGPVIGAGHPAPAARPAYPASYAPWSGPSPGFGPTATPRGSVVIHPPKIKRQGRAGWILLALVIIGGFATSTYVFWDQAGTERARAEAAEAEVEAAEALLADTETRVSELSNEKAQVQDERNAATELAQLGAQAALKMADCRDQLLDAMGYMTGRTIYAINMATTLLDAAVPVCQSANSLIEDFADAAG